jgi:virginiamycin B lyase
MVEYGGLPSGSQPQGIVSGGDGYLWFTGYGSGSGYGTVALGRMTTGGALPPPVALNRAHAAPAPAGITADSYGNPWFTEFAHDPDDSVAIGAVDAMHVERGIRDYWGYEPYHAEGITVGTLGVQFSISWFTVPADDMVGSINPLGIVHYLRLAANSTPRGITTGPDGNIYVTEAGSNKIAKILPDWTGGTLAWERPLPIASSLPLRITSGPDRNLWFTENGANQIGRLSPADGSLTEYALPTANSQPLGITSGPDGNVWFTENGANQIGMLDLAGGTFSVTEFTVPTAGSQPYEITLGPDSNLWFTENQAGQLGKLIPDGMSRPDTGGHTEDSTFLVTATISHEADTPEASTQPSQAHMATSTAAGMPSGAMPRLPAVAEVVGRIFAASEREAPTHGVSVLSRETLYARDSGTLGVLDMVLDDFADLRPS